MTSADDSLARRFAKHLLDVVGLDDLRKIDRKNTTPDYSSACASHDYCDANMVMFAAFGRLPKTEADYEAWNDAWNTCHFHGFIATLNRPQS